MQVSWTKYNSSGLATFISISGAVMRGSGIVIALGGITSGIDVALIVTGVIFLAVGIGMFFWAEHVNKKAVERILRNKLSSMAARAKEDGHTEMQP